MKHARSLILGLIISPGIVMTTGCRDHDRQMIFSEPRTLASKAEFPRRKADRNQVAAKPPTAPRTLPPSNGIDVPLVDPE